MAKKGKRRRAIIGIDIGGTKTLLALLDEGFEVIAEEKLRSRSGKKPLAAFEKGLAEAIEKLLAHAAERKLKVKVVGVGVAGIADFRTGCVRSAPNLEFLEGFRLGARLKKLTGAKVFVANDVHTGLYGECTLGAAKKATHVLGVWLGTGVGGAMVIDGKLHLGASRIAGNIGNYVLHAVDAATDAPRKEVLDNVASRTAIAGDAAVLAAKERAPKLKKAAGTDVKDIKSGDLADSIRRGDKPVEKLVRSRIGVVGTALSNLIDFINPDMVVLGGGLVEAMPELIRREIEKAVKAHATTAAAGQVKIAVAQLRDHAGTIGAAKLALDMFSGRPPIDVAL
ncbi:MAG TPA: ROK family protein [Usitatibacter sp.]|nr:ROK family protein [Usitatibacter sp.]